MKKTTAELAKLQLKFEKYRTASEKKISDLDSIIKQTKDATLKKKLEKKIERNGLQMILSSSQH